MWLSIRRQKHLSGDDVAGRGADALGGDDVHVDDLKAGLGVEALERFCEDALEGGFVGFGFVDGHGKF